MGSKQPLLKQISNLSDITYSDVKQLYNTILRNSMVSKQPLLEEMLNLAAITYTDVY